MGQFLIFLLCSSVFRMLIILTSIDAKSVDAASIDYAFSAFNESNRARFAVLKDADVTQGALQLTPDSRNVDSFLVNKSGGVLLRYPIKLWSAADTHDMYKRVASFNTSFSINVYRESNYTAGEGLAFLISPSLDGPPPGSEGGFLGLTNAALNGSPSNRFVAIELDTVKQPYDPDDNHVGLDINGVFSNVTASLTPYGIEIAPKTPTNYTVWINYDGSSRRVRVYMAVRGRPKPAFSVLNTSLDISDYVAQKSYFGFSASTGAYFQLNCILAWNLTVEKLPDDGSNGKTVMQRILIGAAAVIAVVASAGLSAIIIWARRRSRRSAGKDARVLGTLRSLPGTPREFTHKELKKATDSFDERRRLGKGGFGVVYKGVLAEYNGRHNIEVAVKKFLRDDTKGEDDFLCELIIINRLRHKHLVPLLGWCHNNGMLLLVYQYMPHGSLDQHLFCRSPDQPQRPVLTWDQRYSVVVDVTYALHYLHHEFDQMVVHRDIKASNVMLDDAFRARLGDFGLARALEADKNSYTDLDVAGTKGYLAPDYCQSGKATRQSDVFAFGALILELVTGRCSLRGAPGFELLVDWVWHLHRDGKILTAVDPKLANGEFDIVDAKRLLLLGLACSHPNHRDRPTTQAVVQIVTRLTMPPEVPAFKPQFVWPPAEESSVGDSGSLTTVTGNGFATSSLATSEGQTLQRLRSLQMNTAREDRTQSQGIWTT